MQSQARRCVQLRFFLINFREGCVPRVFGGRSLHRVCVCVCLEMKGLPWKFPCKNATRSKRLGGCTTYRLQSEEMKMRDGYISATRRNEKARWQHPCEAEPNVERVRMALPLEHSELVRWHTALQDHMQSTTMLGSQMLVNLKSKIF